MVIDRKSYPPQTRSDEWERDEMVRKLRNQAKACREEGDLRNARWYEKTADEVAKLTFDAKPIPRITPEGNLFTDAIKSGKNK